MNGEEEIKIVISADTSELDKALDKTVKNTEKNAKKLEKSFDGLREDVEKLKQGFNFNQTKNSGLNGLTKQFDKLKQTANKVASSIQKSLNKAFNVKGKVSVKEDVQVDNNENTSTNSMGASLATTGMLGAMLSKSKDLGDKITKPIINVLEMVKQLGKMLESINKIKLNGDNFNIAGIVDELWEFKEVYNDANDTNLRFSQVIDELNKRLQDAQTELNETEIYADGLKSALYDVKQVLKFMGLGENSLIDIRQIEEVERLRNVIKETEDLITKHLQNHSINVPINPQTLTGFKQLTSDLINGTQGYNKYKLVARNAMDSVRYSISETVDVIAKKLNGGEIPKALTVFREFKKQMLNAFSDGFNKPTQHIDNMINKIKQWANNHKKATDDVKKANKSTGASFKSLLQQMLPFASLYGVFTGLKNSITSFVDMGETVSKFNTVFGEMSDNAMEWADSLSSSVAVSKSELMDASSNIMAIGKSMGLTTDKAYEMAISMSELATDMDSFYNATDSLSKVRSALTGEYEPLKAYGIVLTEDAVKAKALAMGLNSASNSSKMLARQALITEQMMASGAMGDATRTANSLSNQLKMLRYNFQALGQAIGSCFGGLLQVVVPVLNKIVSACTVAFNKLAGLINSIFGLFGVKVGGGSSSGGVGSVIGDAIGNMNTSLGNAGAGSGDLADNLASGADSAKEIAKGLMGIDEINSLSSPSDKGGSGGGSGSSGGGAGDLGSLDMGEMMDWSNTESITDVLAGELTEFEQAFLSVFERIKAGFMLFKDSIVSEWTKLKINIDKLGQEMANFFTSCWKNGLDDTALIFGALLGTVTNTTLEIANSIVQSVTGLFKHLNPNDNENTKKFIDGLNNLLMQIQGFIKDAGKWFGQFTTACQPFINNLGDIAMIVGTILSQALADAIELIRDFMNSWAGQAIIESFAGALEWLSGALESCLGFIRDNQTLFEALAIGVAVAYGAFKLINGAITIWNGLMTIFSSIGAICSGVATALGGAIAFLTSPIGLVVLAIGALITAGVLLWKNWDEVKAWCSKTWNAIVKIFDKVKDKVVKIFKQVYDKVSDVVSDIWDEFKDKFPNLADIVEDVFSNVKNIVEKYFDNVKTIIKAVIDVVKALFKGDFSSIGGIVKDAFEKVKSNTQSIWDSIKALIQARLDAIKLVFSTIWNAISSTVKSVWNGISSYFSQVLNAIKNTISGVLDGIKTLFSGVWNTIKSIVSGTLTGIQNAISTVMNGIKNTISTIVNAISSVFSTVFNNVYNVISTIFNSIKNVITNAINSAKTNVSNVVNAISSVFSNGFNNAKNVASTVFNAIKTTISNVMNTVKTSVSNIVNGIKTVFSNGFNGAKNTISNIFNGIKSVISTPLNSVKSTVSSICTTIGNSFKNSFNNAKTTVSNAINSMKNTISSVMNTVKSTISGAVSKIKSYFNFSWSLPKPKMPKFTAKWSTVFGVKIPTGFNISWHKDGGIFTQPTVLGNHGFGEAGHEAILPLSDFYKKEDERFNKLAQQITKNNTNNQPVSIVLELDGQTLGKVTYNSLETLTKTGKIDLGRLL